MEETRYRCRWQKKAGQSKSLHPNGHSAPGCLPFVVPFDRRDTYRCNEVQFHLEVHTTTWQGRCSGHGASAECSAVFEEGAKLKLKRGQQQQSKHDEACIGTGVR